MTDLESEHADTVPSRADVISIGSYPSPTAGTIAPPTAEPLSPWMRAQLERIARDMDAAREELRLILERQA